PRRREPRLGRQRPRRSRAARLALQHVRDRARHARPPLRVAPSLADLIGIFRAAPGAFLGAALLRRLERDAGATRLRQPDRDRLPRRAGAMLAAADLLHLLADEFAGLRRSRFAL